MKFDTLEHMPSGETERMSYIARQRELVMRRETENADGRAKLALDWIERPYQPESNDRASVAAREISSRIGIDAEMAFRVLLCAEDVARQWHAESDNRFRLLDVSFDASRIIGLGCSAVYEIMQAYADLS